MSPHGPGEGMRMYGCEILFSPTTAAEVRGQFASRMGGRCFCERGERCPLLPEDLSPLFQVRREPPADVAS